jgi:hypothetical protein
MKNTGGGGSRLRHRRKGVTPLGAKGTPPNSRSPGRGAVRRHRRPGADHGKEAEGRQRARALRVLRHKRWAVSGKREKVRREKEEEALGKRARPLP